jgi:hypothetical protein
MAGTLLSTSFDAGVPLRDVQEAASHADARTTMRYATGPAPRWTATLPISSPPMSPERPGKTTEAEHPPGRIRPGGSTATNRGHHAAGEPPFCAASGV